MAKESGAAQVGKRVIFRPRWRRQWVHGYVMAVEGERVLLRYGVSTDLFGDYETTQWRHLRHVRPDPLRVMQPYGYPA